MQTDINKLYYGDNLLVLQNLDFFPDESIDLIYLDPPFNSNRDYNANFNKSASSKDTAQIKAFEDSWNWDVQSEQALDELRGNPRHQKVSQMLDHFVQFLDKNDTATYLAMMAPRLVELHRVLKPTGSLYLHCDPTASHYLKILLDQVFDKKNFRNEIVWKKTNSPKAQSKYFGEQHDIIFIYTKTENFNFKPVYATMSEKQAKVYSYKDEKGRFQTVNIVAAGVQKYDGRRTYNFRGVEAQWLYTEENMENLWQSGYLYKTASGGFRKKIYLEEVDGTIVSDLWINGDLKPMQGSSKEYLGYPTQKPVALLKRIVKASSNPGDIVLDPFCGCGTALAAAQELGRKWIGIDITPLAINVIAKRLEENYGLKTGQDFVVVGDPVDMAGAEKLAGDKDKYQFENWALRLVNCIPSKFRIEGGKIIPLKGGDGGFDGQARFDKNRFGDNLGLLIAEVKSSKVGRRDIDIFIKAMERQGADIGIFIVLKPDLMAKDGYSEASKQGFFEHSLGMSIMKIPKVQIWSAEQFLNNQMPILPFGGVAGHIKGKKLEIKKDTQEQEKLI
jgi:site-specific DNA-methyltransferase (adenine-specific)